MIAWNVYNKLMFIHIRMCRRVFLVCVCFAGLPIQIQRQWFLLLFFFLSITFSLSRTHTLLFMRNFVHIYSEAYGLLKWTYNSRRSNQTTTIILLAHARKLWIYTTACMVFWPNPWKCPNQICAMNAFAFAFLCFRLCPFHKIEIW